MRFAASLVGPDDAGDVVSEAVLRTLRVRDLESLEHPAAYLMQAVLNVARSRGRRRTRERTALARLSPPSASELVVTAESSELTEAVMRLPIQQRAAVYLVYWEDLTPSEAAELMGVRAGTVRRYLHLARKKLRGWIDE